MMHAKAWLVDDHWVSLGSANFDPRSLFKNDELNISTSEPTVIPEIEAFFQQGFANSYFVNRKDWQRRSFVQRLIGQFCLLFFWQL
jgi:cardiolipin synthase